jgi:hypothetical protein
MAVRTITQYYYPWVEGPFRDGESKSKPAIYPTANPAMYSYEELQGLAADVVEWGATRWGCDHGSHVDHQAFVNFVNIVMGQLEP